MNFIKILKNRIDTIDKKIKIALIDGDDPRMIEAATKLKKYKFLELTLLIENEIKDKSGLNFINIKNDSTRIQDLENKYFEIRAPKDMAKGKSENDVRNEAKKLIATRPYFAATMLANNDVDGVVGGLLYPTSDILMSAFKIVGPKANQSLISSVMIMHKDEETSFFSDISVNPKPKIDDLAQIGLNAAEFTKSFGIDPRLAFLSFSTSGSAVNESTTIVKLATNQFNEKYIGVKALGEIQLDAAIDLNIRKAKYKDNSYEETANTLIFPDLNSGNIGYKLVQRFGGYGAIGPIIVGANKPINDLSRGSTVDDIINTVLITALQTQGENNE
ncbi:phosphotransacetylase [Mycoplasma sp. Mirounga ES2805-ORL]|uniref:phosphotransacetylase n=1 Tax=Mycoplasma sp. Mirounga ES2805-ORL TaxID=754514 RepID=UPI00197C0CC3|nr:phosphotransacetylase [Mycoplasma sp. Mirounga ES2805-ORL]QSF13381.1 phosphotransacetylase [Mycoplasma sp. Mirounga ES2805-ORL]